MIITPQMKKALFEKHKMLIAPARKLFKECGKSHRVFLNRGGQLLIDEYKKNIEIEIIRAIAKNMSDNPTSPPPSL